MSYCGPSLICPCEAQPLRRHDIEILNGQNPSQAAVPCCVHIECGSKQEGRCMNTPVSEDNDCKGALVESVLPLRYRSPS